MEAKVVPLTSIGGAASGVPEIRVEGDRLVLDHLVVVDHALAAFVASRPEEERASLVERALKIGLTALQDVGVTVNVDVVRAEFEKVLGQTEKLNDEAVKALEETLRLNFADREGRLPKTLEQFLGDEGKLQRFVSDLFDESKRDSAIGRMKLLLGSYFDGDASRLALLLDPTRMGSPLHQFSEEINRQFRELNEKIVELSGKKEGKAEERAKSAAKGGDFEDLLEGMLGDVARGAGDMVERTGTVQGEVMRSKKGDFVITVNPAITAGRDLRIVVEAKAAGRSVKEIRDELREAKENRRADVALAIFNPERAPSGIAPFDFRSGDAYCVVDPESPDQPTLEAGVRLARLLALLTLKDQQVEVDAEAIRMRLAGVREQLEVIKGMKATLTSIGNNANQVSDKLDQMRDGIVGSLVAAEAELRGAS